MARSSSASASGDLAIECSWLTLKSSEEFYHVPILRRGPIFGRKRPGTAAGNNRKFARCPRASPVHQARVAPGRVARGPKIPVRSAAFQSMICFRDGRTVTVVISPQSGPAQRNDLRKEAS